MSDLTEFLLARIGEDEAVARAAQNPDQPAWEVVARERTVMGLRRDVIGAAAQVWNPDTANHIARFDPARVLAECEAKRAAVAEFVDAVDGGNGEGYMAEQALRFMTLPYVDHSDFREEWRP